MKKVPVFTTVRSADVINAAEFSAYLSRQEDARRLALGWKVMNFDEAAAFRTSILQAMIRQDVAGAMAIRSSPPAEQLNG